MLSRERSCTYVPSHVLHFHRVHPPRSRITSASSSSPWVAGRYGRGTSSLDAKPQPGPAVSGSTRHRRRNISWSDSVRGTVVKIGTCHCRQDVHDGSERMFHSAPLVTRDRRVSYDGRASYSSFCRPGCRFSSEAIGMKCQMTSMGKNHKER
jgi:hypothetical protein